MDVRLPDGTIIRNVPEGTTKAQLDAKLKANGIDPYAQSAPPAPQTVATAPPTPAEVFAAFERADAAGDTENAQILADLYRSMVGATPPPTPVAPPPTPSKVQATTEPATRNPITQVMYDGGGTAALFGGIIASLLGAAAGALMYRAVLGSWRSATASRARVWAATGAAFGAFSSAGMLTQGFLLSDGLKLAMGFASLFVSTPLLAGGGVLLAKIFPRKIPTKPLYPEFAETPIAPRATPAPAPATPQPPAPPPTAQAPQAVRAKVLPKEPAVDAHTPDDDPYDVAGRELQTGDKHPGTWARAMVEADGDPTRTEVAYVKLRVAALRRK